MFSDINCFIWNVWLTRNILNHFKCCTFLLFSVLWRSLIKKHNGLVTPSLDVSSLAKITDGYTPGQMDQCCQQILTERRINQLSKKPLTSVEFITPLARLDPVYKEEEEAFKVGLKFTYKVVCTIGA